MNKKTKGSWLIHHTNKLQNVTNQSDYENTFVAGKAGILLSAISGNSELEVNNERLNALARASNINTALELPGLVKILAEKGLVDRYSSGIQVLGLTTASTLDHTSDIFESLNPNNNEIVTIELAERASLAPILSKDISEELSDTYKIDSLSMDQILNEAEQIGFVDSENVSKDEILFFNGNLFRRDHTQKIKKILDSLNSQEQALLIETNELLKKCACISVDQAKAILGDKLFEKVIAVGIFDVSVVSNSSEEAGFMTLPSAFSKYSDSMVDDAFDLAKAFISSITYGITKSRHERGQIKMVEALLKALVRGESVGPVRAIAEDYKVLELKGVVRVSMGVKNNRYGPLLTLLKKEIGELALQAISQGDISEHSLTSLPTAIITNFSGPEVSREKIRRKQTMVNPTSTNDMLTILRTGGI